MMRCCTSKYYFKKSVVIESFVYKHHNGLDKAINTRARYILQSRLGLGINFIQWIPLRSYNATQVVAVALFVVTTFLKKMVAMWNTKSVSLF